MPCSLNGRGGNCIGSNKFKYEAGKLLSALCGCGLIVSALLDADGSELSKDSTELYPMLDMQLRAMSHPDACMQELEVSLHRQVRRLISTLDYGIMFEPATLCRIVQ